LVLPLGLIQLHLRTHSCHVLVRLPHKCLLNRIWRQGRKSNFSIYAGINLHEKNIQGLKLKNLEHTRTKVTFKTLLFIKKTNSMQIIQKRVDHLEVLYRLRFKSDIFNLFISIYVLYELDYLKKNLILTIWSFLLYYHNPYIK
jgi:hypothetical protein